MSNKPAMSVIVIHRQGCNCEDKRCYQEPFIIVHEESIAYTKTKTNATLPPQHEHALRCATLAMTAQFDEEQQES